jgi:hypothetical protein
MRFESSPKSDEKAPVHDLQSLVDHESRDHRAWAKSPRTHYAVELMFRANMREEIAQAIRDGAILNGNFVPPGRRVRVPDYHEEAA